MTMLMTLLVGIAGLIGCRTPTPGPTSTEPALRESTTSGSPPLPSATTTENTAIDRQQESPPRCAGCEAAQRIHGTCTDCSRRWVAGVEIPSALFHEALDAHGHEIDPDRILCLECADAVLVDGFCRRCRMGYLDDQLYFSELSWSLHHGRAHLLSEVTCPRCRAIHGSTGTCARCGTAWAGNVAFTERSRVPMAIRQFQRLQAALDRLPRCEMCATAGFFGRPCPTCGTPPIPGVLSPLPAPP